MASMGLAADTNFGNPITIDLSQIEEGSQIKIVVNGAPVYIRHRTQQEIDQAIKDDRADLPNPEIDADRLRSSPNGQVNRKYLIVSAVCSHFGSVVIGPSGDFNGWYCPSHGAHFDMSGRVRKGPAPYNLSVPDYKYVAKNIVVFPNRKNIRGK